VKLLTNQATVVSPSPPSHGSSSDQAVAALPAVAPAWLREPAERVWPQEVAVVQVSRLLAVVARASPQPVAEVRAEQREEVQPA